MNVINFINSKDIREHLKNINYQFNSLEIAWLIYQCNNATIEEKHNAWLELIETMPDCEIKERSNTLPQESLHKYLGEYIACESKLLEEFFTPAENWIYTLEWRERGTWFSQDIFYKTFETAQKEFLKEYEDWEEKYKYKITKRKIESTQYISVYFDLSNRPYNYDFHSCTDSLTDILYGVFDGLWFDFPTPFKKGDILCEYDENGRETNGLCKGPFVMIGITTEETRESTRKNGDSTDMNAWGYFQTNDGTVYHEVMWNYMNLEYYRGDISGIRRILRTVSSFVKGDINEELLCKAYHYFLLEKCLKESIPQGYTDEGMRLTGFDI